MEDVTEFSSEIQIAKAENRQERNKPVLKQTSTPLLRKSIIVKDVSRCFNIYCMTSGQVWVSDRSQLVLSDTTGSSLYRLTYIRPCSNDVYTVSIAGELIYIDRCNNIYKLSVDNKTRSLLIKKTDPWDPFSVYCCPSTGDLLVGLERYDLDEGYIEDKVMRYNSFGQEIHGIQNNNRGQKLFSDLISIRENHNGDVILCNSIDSRHGSVVVTDHEGRHRFSYTGPPSGSPLNPWGICTDALSHILVCECNTGTVQMIDKDGHFLSVSLTKQHGIKKPWCLSYDDKTQCLWVGCQDSNVVTVYKYLTTD
ncbi:uncharacterized protein LOC133198667 [Saccostrea echinata]|uniref:uncharacterized protein LOC133198667 n=1 Tax=Saccostrea echinata TaxID=191078 RepID=UPI002A817004|nr:uncharacterized protein LOC133198667 [Saccostrea echinata]